MNKGFQSHERYFLLTEHTAVVRPDVYPADSDLTVVHSALEPLGVVALVVGVAVALADVALTFVAAVVAALAFILATCVLMYITCV